MVSGFRNMDVNMLIKKALLMIVNGLLAYYISYSFLKSVSSAEIISALVFALSFLIGEALVPFTVLAEIIILFQSYLYSLIQTGRFTVNSDLIEFISSVIFLFVIPLISLVIIRNPRSFITAGSIILSNINPVWSILIFGGISQSEGYTANILSAIPLLIFYFYFDYKLFSIIAIALMVAAAVAYALKNYYGFAGTVLLIVVYALLQRINYPISIFSIIISAAVYAINVGIFSLISARENKRAYENVRNITLEEIKNINSILYTVKEEIKHENKDLGSTLNGYINEVIKIQDKLSQCKNTNCIEEVRNELNNIKRIITIELNNLIFDDIRSYNEFSEKLRFLGINLPEIEYPKEEVKIEEFLDYYHNLKGVIEKNITMAANIFNSFLDNLSKSLGIYIQKIKILNTDEILEKAKNVDVKDIDTKLNLCLSKGTEIAQLLLTSSDTFELKKEIATLPLQQFTVNKLAQATKVLEKFTSITLSELSMAYSSFREIYTRFSLLDLKNIEDVINSLIATLQSPNTPYCEKIDRLYDSIVSIEEMLDYVKDKDVLLHLEEIIDAMMPQLREKTSIEIDELGIDEKYVKFLVEILNSKGFRAKVEGNKIVFLS